MSSVKAGINELEIFGGQVALLEALEISRFVYSDDGMDKSDAKNEAERTNYIWAEHQEKALHSILRQG